MRCDIDFFWSEEEAFDIIERFYKLSMEQQDKNFVLTLGRINYIFPKGMSKEERTKKIKDIYKKNKPP